MAKTPISSLLHFENDLLTRAQAAEYLGVKPNTLAVWASTKRYPLPFIRIGRSIKYRLQHLDDFIASQTIKSADEEETL